MRLALERDANVVFLTGAGISVGSGLRPYRGPGGLWTEGGKQDALSVSGFEKDPDDVWGLMGPLRKQALAAEPNAAHRAIAAAAARCGTCTVITQNVDGLHQRAGSQNVVEIHGSLFRTRCSRAACATPVYEDRDSHRTAPACPLCGAPLRPDVLFFGEAIPVDEERAVKTALRNADLFIAVGTSGTVSPASGYVRGAQYAGAQTHYVNLEPMEPANPYFQHSHLGRAEVLLPSLLGIDDGRV